MHLHVFLLCIFQFSSDVIKSNSKDQIAGIELHEFELKTFATSSLLYRTKRLTNAKIPKKKRFEKCQRHCRDDI